MNRRDLLAGAAALLGTPHVIRAQDRSVPRIVPQADLAILDLITSVSYVTRNHALMVFDTLYGVDIRDRAHPQMVAGHAIEQERRYLQKTAYRSNLVDVQQGLPVFYGVRRA